jgi:hypothetical protein
LLFTLAHIFAHFTQPFKPISSALTALILGATFVSAAALPSKLPRKLLTKDDVILYIKNGRSKVMKCSEYKAMKRSNYSVIAASGNPFYNPDDAPSADATVYCHRLQVHRLLDNRRASHRCTWSPPLHTNGLHLRPRKQLPKLGHAHVPSRQSQY